MNRTKKLPRLMFRLLGLGLGHPLAQDRDPPAGVPTTNNHHTEKCIICQCFWTWVLHFKQCRPNPQNNHRPLIDHGGIPQTRQGKPVHPHPVRKSKAACTTDGARGLVDIVQPTRKRGGGGARAKGTDITQRVLDRKRPFASFLVMLSSSMYSALVLFTSPPEIVRRSIACRNKKREYHEQC